MDQRNRRNAEARERHSHGIVKGLRPRGSLGAVFVLAIVVSCVGIAAASAGNGPASPVSGSRIPGHYIVVLEGSVAHPGAVAQAQTEPGEVGFVYHYSLRGYSAALGHEEVEALRRDPRVAYVVPDRRVGIQEGEIELETEDNGGVEIFESTIPTGVNRIFAPGNKMLDIDGKDDLRADVDVAVIDTGIDNLHPDLNVVSRTDCSSASCIENSGKDGNSHGTHVAGTIAAIDNGEGVVGVAPGARLWAVKVLNDSGFGSESAAAAGVDWVTAHAKEIEVANMSLGCPCSMPALDKAINKSAEAGVVYAVAAGNSNSNAESASPASNPNVITVSALADYDGLPGGKVSATCQNYGLDDNLASFSNYGKAIEVAAPGVCILSTLPGGLYGYKSGTSMASPHVAGAAAILASQSNPGSLKDVEAIRSTIVKEGNFEWTDTSKDGVQEPLLDVSDETVFKLVSPPKNLTLPVVSPSNPLKGVAETTSNGTWAGSPAVYSYQWKRCNLSGGECESIAGATKSSYTPVEADLKHTLVAVVTASNAAGEASAVSQATGEVRYSGQIIEYSLPASSQPIGIAVGPDGNLWYTDCGTNKIGKITTSGTITQYSSTEGSCPIGIAPGPDGNLWFSMATAGARVAKITTSGTITYYKLSKGMNNGRGIVTGPDKNVWFTATEGKVGKITTSGTFTPYTITEGSTPDEPTGIASGPDGNLWFTEHSGHKITKITTSGTFTEYSLPVAKWPYGIVSGPDGKLWFAAEGKVGKITTTGTITEYSLPSSGEVKGIAVGPDGNLWFAHTAKDKVGKITTSGTATEYSLPVGSQPWNVVAGPDGNVWFTNNGTNKIGMIVP